MNGSGSASFSQQRSLRPERITNLSNQGGLSNIRTDADGDRTTDDEDNTATASAVSLAETRIARSPESVC
eukprot:5312117-Pleurochrysis_carterae.AAC.1